MMIKKYSSFFVMAFALLAMTACEKTAEELEPVNTNGEEVSVETETEMTEGVAENETSTIEAGEWTLDTNKSIVTWTGSKVGGSSHTGTVAVKEGNFVAEAEGPTGGEFVMDMTAMTESKNNEGFLTHMKSDDFFSVAQFPEAKFVITEITSKGADQFDVKGDLTIRGITKPIAFEAMAKDDAVEKNLTVKAAFQIDRTQWDIRFDSSSFFQNLGDKAIKDEIDFDLDLAFYPKAA